jgi:hypothetical protein
LILDAPNSFHIQNALFAILCIFDLLIPNGPSLCIFPDFNPISSLSVDLHTGKTISALMASFYVDWSHSFHLGITKTVQVSLGVNIRDVNLENPSDHVPVVTLDCHF